MWRLSSLCYPYFSNTSAAPLQHLGSTYGRNKHERYTKDIRKIYERYTKDTRTIRYLSGILHKPLIKAFSFFIFHFSLFFVSLQRMSSHYLLLFAANFAFILAHLYGYVIKRFYRPDAYADDADFPARFAKYMQRLSLVL